MQTGTHSSTNQGRGYFGNVNQLGLSGGLDGQLQQEQSIMGFDFERFPAGDEIEGTPEHKQAVELGGGLPISSRVIDRERRAILYCLSVGGGPENERPGRYLLFYKGQITHVRAFMDERWVDGVGNVTTYRVSGVGVPPDLEAERAEIIQLIHEALVVEGRSYPVPPSVVDVVFK